MNERERDGEKKSKCWNVGQRVRKDHARIFNKVLHKVFTAKKDSNNNNNNYNEYYNNINNEIKTVFKRLLLTTINS